MHTIKCIQVNSRKSFIYKLYCSIYVYTTTQAEYFVIVRTPYGFLEGVKNYELWGKCGTILGIIFLLENMFFFYIQDNWSTDVKWRFCWTMLVLEHIKKSDSMTWNCSLDARLKINLMIIILNTPVDKIGWQEHWLARYSIHNKYRYL